jgi:cupin fold WbuC family metalloprotein
MIKAIDSALLDEVTASARAAARGRKNFNFHPRDDYPAHRLLNGIEPGSYIAPHRHLDPTKDETMVVLRGALGLVVFDDAGAIVRTQKVGAGAAADGVLGIDIAHGTWHTVLALEPGTVFLEAKSGPYLPLSDAERAPWAPAESAAEAPAYLAGLRRLFE